MENIKIVHMIEEIFHLTVYYLKYILYTLYSNVILNSSMLIWNFTFWFVIFSLYFSFIMSLDK